MEEIKYELRELKAWIQKERGALEESKEQLGEILNLIDQILEKIRNKNN